MTCRRERSPSGMVTLQKAEPVTPGAARVTLERCDDDQPVRTGETFLAVRTRQANATASCPRLSRRSVLVIEVR